MNGNYDIHGVHPYPCKFPPQSIHRFIGSGGGTLVDPFCGSGTTILEASANGWKQVYGFDSNPIAVLIARFKVLPTDKQFFVTADSLLAEMIFAVRKVRPKHQLDFPGATHWFAAHVLDDLERIVEWIDAQKDEKIKTWLQLSLSRIINRVSRQDSETRYVAVDRQLEIGETIERFTNSAGLALKALRDRPRLQGNAVVKEVDIRTGVPLPDASVNRIVSSPPYVNSMDYYLYHKQRMNVLGLDFKRAQHAEMGSRHEYSSQRAPIETWFRDYEYCLREFLRVLAAGGDAIVIIGDSQVAGKKIDAAHVTAEIGDRLGFETELVESVPLDGRSRSFSRGFQRPNKYEHILRLVAPLKSMTASNDAVLVVANRS